MTQIAPGKSTAGVLQIPVAATQKNPSSPPKKTPKLAAPRLKLLVRRLPPGLTQSEFESALGPEWLVGAGKVDWFQYKPGKVSKDHAKPSRPSRAYIHVVSSDHIPLLSDKVRDTPFLDSRNTSNDSVLLGPPSLEFAPYAKIAGSRVRKDARQGTIDQDPEFIAFLESLTQPIAKPATLESADAEEKKEVVTTTPLVQYIKEKKANKAKESSGKSSKHAKGDKEPKPEKIQAKKLLQRPDKDSAQGPSTEKAEKKPKADKATREALKAANKAANIATKQAAKSSTAQNSTKDTSQSAPFPERKRERGNVAAAAKILQRDLGLAPSGGRRRAGKATSTDTDQQKNEPASSETGRREAPTKPSKGTPSAQNVAKPKSSTTQSSERAPSRGQPETAAPPTPTSSTPPPAKSSKSAKGKQPPAATTATATQAFLKHANPSQGVTEPLLEAAFASFGKILKVEIDKKKGFGYIDFAEPDGLQKAIAASPVTVAQSQVVVLERKQNPGAEKSRGKGRSEPQPPNAGGSNKDNSRGGKSGEGGSGAGTPSSSRGPRGGRGSKNKSGPKANGGGNANSNATTGDKSTAEAK